MPKSGPLVLEFWEKVCGCLYHQLVSNELEATVSEQPHTMGGRKWAGLTWCCDRYIVREISSEKLDSI